MTTACTMVSHRSYSSRSGHLDSPSLFLPARIEVHCFGPGVSFAATFLRTACDVDDTPSTFAPVAQSVCGVGVVLIEGVRVDSARAVARLPGGCRLSLSSGQHNASGRFVSWGRRSTRRAGLTGRAAMTNGRLVVRIELPSMCAASRPIPARLGREVSQVGFTWSR